MPTDEQVEAACIAYHSAATWAQMPEDRIAERVTSARWDTNRDAEREVMRAALDAVWDRVRARLAFADAAEVLLRRLGDSVWDEDGGKTFQFGAIDEIAAEARALLARVTAPGRGEGE